MELRPERLFAHLAETLAPIYVIHGDEPLFAIEAGDAVRAAARRHGCDEREVLVAEAGFKWDAFVEANANLSLFGARKLIDLRIPSGKPGTEGAKALEAAARHASAEQVLATLPRLDRTAQSSPWFAALANAGVTVAVYPLERSEISRWIASRLARQKQTAGAQTLSFLADRCEGNLLAARQEIEKLGLLLPQGEIDHESVVHAVADVARYDVFQLSEAWLAGDGLRVVRILAALEAEGDSIPHLTWQLGEDLRALAYVIDEAASGTPIAAAVRNVRVWGKRQEALMRATRRVSRESIAHMLRALAQLDAVSKGIGTGNAWDDLESLALELAGKRVVPAPVQA